MRLPTPAVPLPRSAKQATLTDAQQSNHLLQCYNHQWSDDDDDESMAGEEEEGWMMRDWAGQDLEGGLGFELAFRRNFPIPLGTRGYCVLL